MNNIHILRSGSSEPLWSLAPDDSFVCSARQMGEQTLRLSLSAPSALDLRVGDYVEWDGVPYSLCDEPDYKRSEGVYSYALTLYAPCRVLTRLYHKDEGSLTFPYDGTLAQQLDALYTSIGREASGFTLGIADDIPRAGEFHHIEFDKAYCLDALTTICQDYGTEWKITGRHITVGRGVSQPVGPFRYGRGRGLYSLEKLGVSNSSVVTRLYGYGSKDNLPAGYRAESLVFSGVGGASYLEKNTAKYGIREEAVTFDDIYPHLEDASLGSVVVPADIDKALNWTVTVSLPADCNDIVIEKDREARIKFTGGALMGEAFSITRFDAVTRELDFNISDDNGYKLPSPTRQPSVGDPFVLLGIVMPQSYVARAETRLRERTQQELDRRCEKLCAYRLDIDPRYVRRETIRIGVGDTVLVQEADDSDPVGIRVQEVSYPLSNPDKLSLTLSDDLIYSSYSEKIENDIRDVTHEIDNVYREARAFSRRAWRDAEELAAMLETVRADLVLVGNHAGQFAVSSTFTVNKASDPKLFGCGGGSLMHAVYKGATDGQWGINSGDLTLPDNQAYYLYARCSRSSRTGMYCVEADPKVVDADPEWYYFPVGIISSPFEGARIFNTTYGFTQIAGGSIRTGVLQGNNNNLRIDLDNGEITGKVTFQSGSSGLKQLSEWSETDQRIQRAQAAGNQGISDAAAAQAVTGNFTTVSGGLQLTTQMRMLNGGVETGGLSANLNNILLWGGGTYAGALGNYANIVLRHDGSGQLAKGKINWDTSGDLKIENGAKIGEMDVYNGNLRWEHSGRSISLGSAAVIESGDVTVAKFSVPADNKNIAVRIAGNLLFSRGAIEGLSLRLVETAIDYEVKFSDVYIVCTNTTHNITVTLPYQPNVGRTLYLRRHGGYEVFIKPGTLPGNIGQASPESDTITRAGSMSSTSITDAIGDTAMLVYTGKTWLYHFMGR